VSLATVAYRFSDFPLAPPRDLLKPRDGIEAIVTVIVIAVFAAIVAFISRYVRRDREAVGVLLMLGAVIAVVNDPLVEVAGRCFFYTKIPVFNTMGRQMPLWGPFAYGILFGTETFALYRLASLGRLDMPRLRLIILSTFLLDLAIEVPVLQTHLYIYYGLQPFDVGGFPLYWIFINTPAVVIGAAVLTRRREWFAGWRAIAIPLVPVLAIPASFYTAGLPVLAAMNTTLPAPWIWVAAVLTAALSILIMEATGRVLCAATPTLRPRSARARAGRASAGAVPASTATARGRRAGRGTSFGTRSPRRSPGELL
jgi:hypothetical protein